MAETRYEFPFKTCFVITPYGVRIDPWDSRRSVDFELVYQEIIVKALDGIVAQTHRSKDRTFSGVIHEDMFRQILSADVVICDITLLNANVMYELGVRHAARPNGTIIIRQENKDPPPFNLGLTRVVSYKAPEPESVAGAPGAAAAPTPDAEKEAKIAAAREAEFAKARTQLQDYVRQSLQTRKVDSPVHALIPNLNLVAPARMLETIAVGVLPLSTRECRKRAAHKRVAERVVPAAVFRGTIAPSAIPERPPATPQPEHAEEPEAKRRAPCMLGIATGNLRDIYDAADVWVNPENTRMEMGPMFGETVSSYIRVLGARSRGQTLGRDDVQAALRRALKGERNVLPGRAISTPAGALERTHGVRRIVHVAAQEGFPLSGFSTVRRVGTCVESALEEIDRLNRSFACRIGLRPYFRRVLVPLFGTRNPGVDPADVAKEIILAVKRHLELEPETYIERVLFLATTDHDFELCETGFMRLGYDLKALEWFPQSKGEQQAGR